MKITILVLALTMVTSPLCASNFEKVEEHFLTKERESWSYTRLIEAANKDDETAQNILMKKVEKGIIPLTWSDMLEIEGWSRVKGRVPADEILQIIFIQKGLHQNHPEFIEQIRDQAEAGHTLGQYKYGYILTTHQHDKINPDDLERGLKLIRQAAENGYYLAQYHCGFYASFGFLDTMEDNQEDGAINMKKAFLLRERPLFTTVIAARFQAMHLTTMKI